MMQHKAVCDTISLWMRFTDFKITHPEYFSPNAMEVLLYRREANRKAVQNMSTEDKRDNCYKPKLTLATRFYNYDIEAGLYIELSLPKLLYGENLHEVTDSDFPQIITLLQQVLAEMGVDVTENALKKAQVNRIHYAKNILLKGGVWCDWIMKDIEKANVSKIYDSGHTDYRNDGHCIRFHTKYHEFAVYDKIKDLKQQKKSSSRSVEDKIHTSYQGFDLAKIGNKQVFRIETRLNSTATIKNALGRAKLNISSYRFEDLFNSDIAKTLNLYHWQSIVCAMQPLTCLQDDPVSMWMSLSESNKPLKCLQILGLRCLLDATTCRFITEHIKDNPTAMNLFRELKSYQPQSHYKEQIYDDITKAITENNVIDLPDLICQASMTTICQDTNADSETGNNEPVQGSQSWAKITAQLRKNLNLYLNENILFNGD